jgi:solute carrier family 25 carnitine/acylcarnitine transporter 20/29
MAAPRAHILQGALNALKITHPQSKTTSSSRNTTVLAPSVTESALRRNAKDVLAGTCGGVSVVAAGHPFDTVKVLLATQPTDKPVYGGMFDATRKTLRAEGLSGLYKGVTSPLLGQMFFRSCLFFSYARAKDYVNATPADPSSYAKAGALAWLVSSFVECPIDLYKSQMQTQLVRMRSDPSYTPPYRSIFHCMAQSVQRNGITGPYQGIAPTLLRNVPAGSLYFFVFESMKKRFGELNGSGSPTNTQILLSGAFGGLLYWTAIYPVDLIKSSIQTDSIAKPTRHYNSFFQTARKLYADSGYNIGRFYRGFGPCILRASPGAIERSHTHVNEWEDFFQKYSVSNYSIVQYAANALMLFTVDKMKSILAPL